MKKSIHWLEAALALSTSAMAAAAEMDWSGFYLGTHAAHTSMRSRAATSTVFAAGGVNLAAGAYFQASSIGPIADAGRGKLSADGGSGGFSWGYNRQTGARVLGVELDIGSMNVSASRTAGGSYPCCAPSGFTVSQSIDADWLLTARGRVGHAFDRSLIYATAGLALADLDVQARFADNDPDARAATSQSKTQLGWVVGAGYEHGFEGKWSLKLEYLYIDLGRLSSQSNNLISSAGPFPLSVFTTRAHVRANQIRLGLNKRW